MATLSQAHKPIQISTVFEIGIFEPDVEDPLDDLDFVKVYDLSVYRDVDVFCQHVEDVISVRGPETVRDNLHFCLRGAAIRWWACKLKINEKKAIRNDNTLWLSQWIGRLQNRFRAPAQAVFTPDLIVNDCYPAEDAGEVHSSIDDVVLPPQIDDCVDAPAQAVFEPGLIVDDCHHAGDVDNYHDAGDVFTSVDAAGEPRPHVEINDCYPHPACDVVKSIDDVVLPSGVLSNVVTFIDEAVLPSQIDDCHPHLAGDVVTSVGVCQHADAVCQHAKDVSDLIIDKCPPAGEPGSRVDIDSHALCIKLSDPAGDVVKSIDGVLPPSGAHLRLSFFDIEYPPSDVAHPCVAHLRYLFKLERPHVEYLRYNFKHCTRFKRRVLTSVERPHVNHLRYNSRCRKRRKRWKRSYLSCHSCLANDGRTTTLSRSSSMAIIWSTHFASISASSSPTLSLSSSIVAIPRRRYRWTSLAVA